MINVTFQSEDGRIFRRVTRPQAEKALREGKAVALCASNLIPGEAQGHRELHVPADVTLDTAVKEWAYQNNGCADLWYYTADGEVV